MARDQDGDGRDERGSRPTPIRRRRYTKSEKAKAVGLALVTSTLEAAETMGVPMTTLDYWVHHPDFESLRNKSRDQVADRFWATIQVGLDEVTKGLQNPDTPLRDKSVALGIVWDKHALMTGMATARSENRDITGTLSDADVIDALREADPRTARGRAPEAVEEPAEG